MHTPSARPSSRPASSASWRTKPDWNSCGDLHNYWRACDASRMNAYSRDPRLRMLAAIDRGAEYE